MLASAQIMQKSRLARTRSQCDTGVIQDGFYSSSLQDRDESIILRGLAVSPINIQPEGQFAFRFTCRGLRYDSHGNADWEYVENFHA
jgi:hypothetical protein